MNAIGRAGAPGYGFARVLVGADGAPRILIIAVDGE